MEASGTAESQPHNACVVSRSTYVLAGLFGVNAHNEAVRQQVLDARHHRFKAAPCALPSLEQYSIEFQQHCAEHTEVAS